MDALFQRARSFASEAAKRSQDLAKEAAKISQEIAIETAKRSKEIASEASKKADALKALAGEITPAIALPIPSAVSAAASPSQSSSLASEEELQRYGITSELKEFVNGLTISTFQDFPYEDSEQVAKGSSSEVTISNTRKDLTDWQEQHALLVLKTVPEISQFRYSLCPRLMKERQFWNIYFTLVRNHVAPYEAQGAVQAGEQVGTEAFDHKRMASPATNEPAETLGTASDGTRVAVQEADQKSTTVATPQRNRSIDDQDLDAYLLGDSDGDDDGDGDGDDGFDADFDQLVNSTGIDSDSEEEGRNLNASRSSATKVLTTSDGSSDGELVGFPSDQDTQTTADEDGL